MILPACLILLLAFVFANLGFWDRLASSGLGIWQGAIREYQRHVFYIHENLEDEEDDNDGVLPDMPEYRLSTGSGPGSTITCWPSEGGIYKLRDGHIVQRQFLGFDHYIHKILRPKVSTAVEDAFCKQLRKLGARWWGNEYKNLNDWFEARPDRDIPVLYVGWPSLGGVWVLFTNELDATTNGYGVIYNSRTMEEQCDVIKELGGTFYQDPKDCPYLDLAEN